MQRNLEKNEKKNEKNVFYRFDCNRQIYKLMTSRLKVKCYVSWTAFKIQEI